MMQSRVAGPPGAFTVWGRILVALFLLIGLAAVAGGVGVMRDKLPFPIQWLSGSQFRGYFWPGLILCVVVGGSQFLAAYLLVSRRSFAKAAAVVAACVLLGWLAGELHVIGFQAPIQVFFASLAAIELALSLLTVRRAS